MKELNLKEFGLFFAEKREKSGFGSQRQLSIASGISNGTIARIEAGTQRVSPETLEVIAPFLKGVTYEELMEKAGYLKINKESNVYHIDQIGEPESKKRMKFSQAFLDDLEKLPPEMRESVESLVHNMAKNLPPSDS